MSSMKKEDKPMTKTSALVNPFKKPEAKDQGNSPADKLSERLPSISSSSSSSSSASSSSSFGKKSNKIGEKRKSKSALDEIMELEEKKKEKTNRKENWLCKDIVVKVTFKRLGEKYYKKKAYVKEVKDLFSGIIKMMDSGDMLKVDQTHVETVIPAIGKPLMVVNGAYRGEVATLESLDEKRFCCSIKISQGLLKGRVVTGVQYEDVSKLHMS